MNKRHIIIALTLLAWLTGQAQQKFYNLTADEVKIDSVLPVFSCAMPLGSHYADSVYTVRLAYPEFIDMGRSDVERYHAITQAPLPELPKVESEVSVDRKQGVLHVRLTPLVERGGKMQKLVSFMLEVESQPIAVHNSRRLGAPARASGERYADHSVLASGRWAKIRVPKSGIYQLTQALVQKAGFTDVSRVKVYGYGGALQNETLVPDELIATDDLKEVPQCATAGRRLFFAQGPVSWKSATDNERTRNPYSDYGYYFITESDEAPLTVDEATFVSTLYPRFENYHALREVDNYAWYHGGRRLYENAPIAKNETKKLTLETPGHCQEGSLTVALSADATSIVGVKLNGVYLDTVQVTVNPPRTSDIYQHDKAADHTRVFSVNNIGETNTIELDNRGDGVVRPDYVGFTYREAPPLPDLASAAFDTPEFVYNITNQDLHADRGYQMVIIIPTSQKLRAQAERLKALHEEHDGLRVRVVPADELFNEFASGTPDANAYRRYMKMLYDRATTDDELPRYLLLMGDGAWDNRMLSNNWQAYNPDDFLLCFESENSGSETFCYVDEGFFCYLDDNEGSNPLLKDLADVAVGRIPARTAEEAKVVVDKICAYVENANAGAWQNVAMFMGDDGNNNVHMRLANEAASLVERSNPGILAKRVIWDAYNRVSSSTGFTYPEVERQIKQQQAAGALIMNYSGHGAASMLSHEQVLFLDDFREFTNTNLPMWLAIACDVMPFDSHEDNIGEAALFNSKGGAVAFFSTTRTVYTGPNEYMDKNMLEALFTPVNGEYVSIGEAQRIAKNWMTTGTKRRDNSVNKLHFQLLGDPAMKLHIPSQAMVIDSINGVKATGSDMQTLRAGSIVTVSGHVEGTAGADDSFGGTATLVVRDAEEHIICKLNNTSQQDGASSAFGYYDRNKTLFTGTDSVQAGRFRFTFAVPLDISYSDQTGYMNLFATNSAHTKSINGAFDDFIVGGSEAVANDSIGPSIFCYLNSPEFTNGDNVNATPYFVAVVKDKDGLNTTGNGIGHDLELIVDGELSKTYILNDQFLFDFGSYTSGTTSFTIPELEEGPHKLKFRAWDVLNNCSTAELNFNVVHGLEPVVASIGVTQNPVRNSTVFVVTHDRMGSNIDVDIEVFDMSGRLLWNCQESGVAQSATFTKEWDLTTDNGGRLQTGVYLYRVRLSSDGSTKASKAKKLIVIN